MSDRTVETELREIGVAIAGIEIATWAAMRAIFAANPAAAEILRGAYPALLQGIGGDDAPDVKARVEAHMKRWLSS